MRPDLVAVTSTTRPSTVASTAAIQLSAPLWGASAMACMSAPSPDARSQGEPSHQIERGALVRMHHRGLEPRSEFEVPPGNERTEPEPAAISGVPSGRALVGDEDASDVGQPQHAESERQRGVESAERDLQLRVPDHGRIAREPVQRESSDRSASPLRVVAAQSVNVGGSLYSSPTESSIPPDRALDPCGTRGAIRVRAWTRESLRWLRSCSSPLATRRLLPRNRRRR